MSKTNLEKLTGYNLLHFGSDLVNDAINEITELREKVKELEADAQCCENCKYEDKEGWSIECGTCAYLRGSNFKPKEKESK